jgi:hypothetical protein
MQRQHEDWKDKAMHKSARRKLTFVLIAALMLIPLSVARAKGPPEQVTISGPGINGEITITGSDVLNAFSFYQFNDLNRILDAPPQIEGEGYHITRWLTQQKQGTRQLLPWDTLTYYPDPAGGPGYVYFDGLDPSIGSTQGQGEWYVASEAGGAAMTAIIANHAAAQRASSKGVPTALPVAALIMLLIASAAVIAIRARRDQGAALPA